jgi:predicted permease
METIFQDLRYGLRSLLRNRWSTVITVLSLALGIGVNCVVLTCYKAFFLRPLDAHNAGQMVNIALTRNSGVTDIEFSYPDYQSFSESVPAFSGLIAVRPANLLLSNAGEMISQRTAHQQSTMGRLGLPTLGANAEFAHVFVVSENYFKVLGVSIVQGRSWDTANTDPLVATPSVLVSENYWKRRFPNDPVIVGKKVHLNGVEVTVIGVTPHNFVGTGISTPAFWIPISIDPLINGDRQWLLARANRRYRLFGRLAPGATVAQAEAQITTVADHLWTLHEAEAQSKGLGTKPAAAMVWTGSPLPLPLNQFAGLNLAIGLTLFGAAIVLGVACANVGSLQVARARSRETELRTRFSLGATRVRVVRQLLTESALLGLLSGALALLISWGLLKIAVKLFADFLPVQFGDLVFDVNPDLTLFASVFLISLLAGVLAGLSPAMQSARAALTSIGRGSTTSIRNRRLEGVLVSVQVAFSLVLMISGAMFILGAVNSLGMETGYDNERIVRLDFQFPDVVKYTADRKTVLLNEVRLRTGGLPGVTGLTRGSPPGSGFRTVAVPIEEGGGTGAASISTLSYTYVGSGYFETLGIPLLLGGTFDTQIGNGRFVVLSKSAAREVFGQEVAVGRRIRMGLIDERPHLISELVADGPDYQVVGVVGDTRGFSFDDGDSKQIYIPLTDDRADSRPLLVRTQSDPAAMISTAEEMIASIDSGIVVTSFALAEAMRQSPPFITSSFAAAIASVIGLLGLLLALMGIFGTVNHMVALRTREVGIRMALGARRHDVLTLILREISRYVFAGLTFGMALAAAVVYLLRGIFYGISAVDGIYFVIVSTLFLIAALLAAYPPARQATRVDPMTAVRCE